MYCLQPACNNKLWIVAVLSFYISVLQRNKSQGSSVAPGDCGTRDRFMLTIASWIQIICNYVISCQLHGVPGAEMCNTAYLHAYMVCLHITDRCMRALLIVLSLAGTLSHEPGRLGSVASACTCGTGACCIHSLSTGMSCEVL